MPTGAWQKIKITRDQGPSGIQLQAQCDKWTQTTGQINEDKKKSAKVVEEVVDEY